MPVPAVPLFVPVDLLLRRRVPWLPTSGPMPGPPRTLLGWAVEQEHAYTTEYQCQRAPSYYDQRCYLRGPGGEVIWIGPAGWDRLP